MNVYLLQHGSKINHIAKIKIIGICSCRIEAEEARSRAIELSGFRDAPDGFSIDPYEFGADYWTTGFVTQTDVESILTETAK